MNKLVSITYSKGHTIRSNWKKSDYHCPSCASKEVWEGVDETDYYQGNPFYCTSCKVRFYLMESEYDEDLAVQLHKQLMEEEDE